MSEYKATIGIEVHVEVKSNTKLFSNSKNTYGMPTNTCVNPVDLGYPGTLPTLNKEVVRQGIKACKVLHCDISKVMHFDRKNYFYPDNPKNYQITQNRTPIGRNGYIEIEVDGQKKKIEIEEMHIEEDTCKSAHRGEISLLDFNRAGVPLIEIVTKPCISSSAEAMKYLEKLKETLFYANISDCKMEEGSMRCDANVSISKTDTLGVKTEIKNIGSIHNVGLSIDKEIARHKELLEKGETLQVETRRFDSKKNDTVLMRVKETGNDYRYFPEPDIPYLYLTEEMIEEAKKEIPLLPDELRSLYKEKGIKESQIEKLISNRSFSSFFTELIKEDTDYKIAANLLLGDIASYLNRTRKDLGDTTITVKRLVSLISHLSDGSLSMNNIKDLIDTFLEEEKSVEEIMKEKNIQNIKDDSLIKDIIARVIANNEESVNDYKSGHDRALKYLMGQVMKESKGQVNPSLANKLLQEELTK
ncbi:MAG: Asp-tRNA(Asn)/Glu-tRNA(Gln) amidotransferase subunit GatB [bacterium]|nr:Asp-tRNA(Asn)/Glu-tRNA(Gln) amidotransferase subunit GatB [bacterium]